jgi:hypothetical protein
VKLLLYAFGVAYGVTQLVTGKEKVPTLVGLAIGGTTAWFYLKAAARKALPQSEEVGVLSSE